jgi:hypothetical protein
MITQCGGVAGNASTRFRRCIACSTLEACRGHFRDTARTGIPRPGRLNSLPFLPEDENCEGMVKCIS